MDAPEDFTARLDRLATRYRPGMFHLTDNAVPPAILKALGDRGSPAPWYGFVRPGPELADAGFVRALRASGCRMLQVGIETPDPLLIARMRKGVDPALFGSMLLNLREAGIASYVYLLFGLPGQGQDACEAARSFVAENPVDFLNASIFRLPPDAAMAIMPDLFGVDHVSDRASSDLYCRFEAAGLAGAELRRWLADRFYRQPAVREASSRTPRYFKSNHAVFFAR